MMKKNWHHFTNHYFVRIALSLLITGIFCFFIIRKDVLWSAICGISLAISVWWQWKLYQQNTKKILFLLDAIENNDSSLHFSEQSNASGDRIVNRALNRIASILYNVKSETAQQEKYYELILNCISTGVIVLNDSGAVYQKNDEALRLFGLEIFTHIRQLNHIDTHLPEILAHCRPGEKLQVSFSNERNTINLSIHVSEITIRKEHLRILAFSDINSELDEKEIDSWIRLTRVLTHEIMNSITPITSLSDTLLYLTTDLYNRSNDKQSHSAEDNPVNQKPKQGNKETMDEIRDGLQTISTTGKGLLAFMENYRRFTRIPTPSPSLFYIKAFIERMIRLAQHQYPETQITFQTNIIPPDLIVYADESLISQVVTNILKNAIQALSGKELSDRDHVISIRSYCNETEAILIEISNNGPGIPRDIAEHIFIPFFTTKEKGSGIGLSISRQIMRLSGGSLSLRPGKETTFVLRFN